MANSRISLKVLPQNQVVSASQGHTLLETLLAAEIEISHSCGGFGTCGTCRIFVREGLEKLAPRNEVETEMANDRQFRAEERLCCQNEVVPGLVIEIPEVSEPESTV